MGFMFTNVKEVHAGSFSWKFWEDEVSVNNTNDIKDTKETKEVEVVKETKETKEIIPVVPIILQKIKWCESRDRQFNDDGTVKRGKINPKDVGLFQINELYHLVSSKKLGMDIYTVQGNTEYALYLYKTQGTKPWDWSKPCWGQNLTLNELKAKYK